MNIFKKLSLALLCAIPATIPAILQGKSTLHARTEHQRYVIQLLEALRKQKGAMFTLYLRYAFNQKAPIAFAPQQKKQQLIQPQPKLQQVPPQQPQPKLQLPPHNMPPIAPCLFDRKHLMHLPGLTGGQLAIPGIYHLRSHAEVPIQQRFSCGFHALYNAVKLERALGTNYISDQAYLNACRTQVPEKNLHGFSTNRHGSAVAAHMGLNNYYNLWYKNGFVDVLFDSPTNYTYYHGQDKKKIAQQAVNNRRSDFWATLRHQYRSASGPFCLHFSCNIMSHSRRSNHSEPHAVLITAVRMANGAIATYIADNMNDDENHISQSEIRACVEHIHRQLVTA